MKKLLSAFSFIIAVGVIAAQPGIDSLEKQLSVSKPDTNRVLILSELVIRYVNYNHEMALKYSNQGIALARSLKFSRGEADCLRRTGIVLFHEGRYPEALEKFHLALRISESINDSFGIGAGLGHVGNIYNVQGQYAKARPFYFRTLKISESRQDVFEQVNALRNLGRSYLQEGHLDSASIAYNKAYTLVSKKPDTRLATLWNELGEFQAKTGNQRPAMAFFRKSIAIAAEVNGYRVLSEAYFGIAKLYSEAGQKDSIFFYAKQAIVAGQKINYAKGVQAASKLLSKEYEGVNELEAFKYLKMATAIDDSLFNSAKATEVQNLFFLEQQRQQSLEAARVKYKNQIKLYVLLSALGVFLLIALLLYRNNMQNQKSYALLRKQKDETEKQKVKVEQTLDELKTTQAQLVQREKMASLGELTAGIAHEIQNPLNFVNNFSEVSVEMLEEQKDQISDGNKEEAIAIAEDIKENLQKVVHHGKRADAIVKGMLQHSKSSTGQKEPTDINALTNEYLRLSYHGLRAKDKSFDTTIETLFDESIGKIEIIPQDIGRVLLNLFNNAFYAVMEKKKQLQAGYEPVVSLNTEKENDRVLISVKDNGNGIPEKAVDKIFQPFFTTKPTGEGTGLGLSLSYDIVKAHGGDLTVSTREGEGAAFIVSLPTKSSI